jgi:hypothetical protein
MSDRHDTLPEEFYLSDFEEFFVGVDTSEWSSVLAKT